MRRSDYVAIVTDRAIGGRVLEQYAEGILVKFHLRGRYNDYTQTERRRARSHDGSGLRMAVGGDDESSAITACSVARHRHGFSRSGRLIEQRRVGDFHCCQVAHHSLEIQQCLESALRNFRLVWCICSIPARILEQVASQRGWRYGAIVTHPEIAARHHVASREFLQSM